MTSAVQNNLTSALNINGTVQAPRSDENFIFGGNFDTNPWQRGVTFTSVSDGTYTADRFSWQQVGSGVVDVLKTADAPTLSNAGVFTSNCLNVDVTTADASIAAGDLYTLRYVIEGYDWAQIAQRTFTLAFWVKSTVTGTYCVSFTNDVDKTWIAQYTVNTTNTWEFKTITVPASPSAGTWNYTTGIGLRINFVVACGSTYQSTANTWLSASSVFATSSQANGMSSSSNFFKLQLITINPGEAASPFHIRTFKSELELCQRYYEKSYNQGAYAGDVTAVGAIDIVFGAASTSALYASIFMKTRKRAAPTITVYDTVGASGKVFKGANGKTAAAGGVGDSIFTYGTNDATSTNELTYQWTANAEL